MFITAGILAGWTIPPETLGKGIIDFGKFRQHLADIIPVLPSIATKLPRLLYVVAPHFGTLFPHLGTVAPHLGALLPHAEMLTRIIPKLSTKLDLLLQGDLLEKVAPAFAALDAEHMARLEMVLDDVVDKLDVLAPHIGTFTPILEDGIMVADRMLPFIEFVIPHLVALRPTWTGSCRLPKSRAWRSSSRSWTKSCRSCRPSSPSPRACGRICQCCSSRPR